MEDNLQERYHQSQLRRRQRRRENKINAAQADASSIASDSEEPSHGTSGGFIVPPEANTVEPEAVDLGVATGSQQPQQDQSRHIQQPSADLGEIQLPSCATQPVAAGNNIDASSTTVHNHGPVQINNNYFGPRNADNEEDSSGWRQRNRRDSSYSSMLRSCNPFAGASSAKKVVWAILLLAVVNILVQAMYAFADNTLTTLPSIVLTGLFWANLIQNDQYQRVKLKKLGQSNTRSRPTYDDDDGDGSAHSDGQGHRFFGCNAAKGLVIWKDSYRLFQETETIHQLSLRSRANAHFAQVFSEAGTPERTRGVVGVTVDLTWQLWEIEEKAVEMLAWEAGAVKKLLGPYAALTSGDAAPGATNHRSPLRRWLAPLSRPWVAVTCRVGGRCGAPSPPSPFHQLVSDTLASLAISIDGRISLEQDYRSMAALAESVHESTCSDSRNAAKELKIIGREVPEPPADSGVSSSTGKTIYSWVDLRGWISRGWTVASANTADSVKVLVLLQQYKQTTRFTCEHAFSTMEKIQGVTAALKDDITDMTQLAKQLKRAMSDTHQEEDAGRAATIGLGEGPSKKVVKDVLRQYRDVRRYRAPGAD